MQQNKEKQQVQICMNEVEELDIAMRKDANNKEKSFKQKLERIGKVIKEFQCKLVKMANISETNSIEV